MRHSFRLYLPWGGNTIIERIVPDQAGCGDTRGQVIQTSPIIESVYKWRLTILSYLVNFFILVLF